MIDMDINDEILDLWKSFSNKLRLTIKKNKKEEKVDLYWPNLFLKPKDNTEFLIVGLNPSHKFPNHINKTKDCLLNNKNLEKNKIIKKITDPSYLSVDGVVSALIYNKPNEYSKSDILKFEEIGQDEHNYFQKLWALGKKVTGKKNTTSHIDLYQFRHADSSIIKDYLIIQNEEFFNLQAELTFKRIELLNPELIFVANKYASDKFIEKYKCKFDKNIGCHIININDKKIPLILSGMITQSRSIDNYSFERLTWHMRKIFSLFKSLNSV